MSRFTRLWRNLTQRGAVDRDLDDELRACLELTIEEKRRAGVPGDLARRQGLAEFGGLEQIKERVRDVRAGALVEQLIQDLSYAGRMLRKHAAFTAVAVTTLALGIGANTAVFSVVDTVVFRPLPYERPDRLLKICGTGPRDTACDDDFTIAEVDAIRAQVDAFEQVALDDGTSVRVVHPDGSRDSVSLAMVSTNWLSTLGVQPILGRDFSEDESRPGRDRVVVLTNDYWRRRFRSDPRVCGTTLAVDGVPYTVVGVLPPNVLRSHSDLLKPFVGATYSDSSLDVFGRLRPGATAAEAGAALDVVGHRLEQTYPVTNRGRHLGVEPLGKYYAAFDRKAARGLVLMLGAVVLVLLVACANVANLMLARSGARRRESVVRSALGASRGRLVRQFLIENVLLFLAGGALGLLMARISLNSLAALAVSGGYLPERMTVALDGRVLVMCSLASLITGIVFGLAPALQSSRVHLAEGLRESARTQAAARHGGGRRLLMISQLALSLVLLAGFGLLMRSFEHVYAGAGGFNPRNLLVTDSEGGRVFPQATAFWRAAMDRVRTIPGVTSVAVTSRPPVHRARQQRFVVDGRPGPDDGAEAGDILVSADYFRTLGIPLLRGRAFGDADNERARPVVIISESVARRNFPGQDPVGRRLRIVEQSPMTCCSAPGGVDGVWREIVGVAGDVRQENLDDEPAQTIYRPYAQIVEHDMYLVLRAGAATGVDRVAREVRSRLTAPGASDREWSDVATMGQIIGESESIRLRRFVLILLGSFAGIALMLAAVGIYGVASTAVGERTREIGVRIALGATQPAILRHMLGEMMALAAAGAAAGTAGTIALTRLIRTMLFGVGPADGVTYAAVTLILGAVVSLATYIPSRRATKVDPVVALRTE